MELAPLFFGGLEWLGNPELSRLARLAFCQTLADACANRLFFDSRALKLPRPEALVLFAEALSQAQAQSWPHPTVFEHLAHVPLCLGPADQWISTRAARERIALDERELFDLSFPPSAPEGLTSKRL